MSILTAIFGTKATETVYSKEVMREAAQWIKSQGQPITVTAMHTVCQDIVNKKEASVQNTQWGMGTQGR